MESDALVFFQMHAELQVLSPLVPVREVQFLRFCKQLTDGAWAIVDVSVDATKGDQLKCRRLPSGCVVQDTPNGYSKARIQSLPLLPHSSMVHGSQAQYTIISPAS